MDILGLGTVILLFVFTCVFSDCIVLVESVSLSYTDVAPQEVQPGTFV